MCKTPVTFGGGIRMVNGSLLFGSDLNTWFFIQYSYQNDSRSAGV